MTELRVHKLIAAAFATLAGSVLLAVGSAAADPIQQDPAQGMTPDPSVIALEIVPTCSDASTSLAHWAVTNKNSQPVEVDWTNKDSGQSGVFNAAPGSSELLTNFDATDPNNTTQFIWAGNITQTNATQEACQPATPPTPPQPVCVDGSIHSNLTVDWVSNSQIMVHTTSNEPLCSGVNLYLTSYLLADTYNGHDFSTSLPQSLYDSTPITLEKGDVSSGLVTVSVPEACKSYQIDAYYAPEVPAITDTQRIGSHLLSAKTIVGTGTCQQTPPCDNNPGTGTTTPTTPGTPETPATPTLPTSGGGFGAGPGEESEPTPVITTASVVTPTPTPTQVPVAIAEQPMLADTGAHSGIPSFLATILIASSIGIALTNKKQKA